MPSSTPGGLRSFDSDVDGIFFLSLLSFSSYILQTEYQQDALVPAEPRAFAVLKIC